MAIKAYVGRMGSGKTYEVVTEVILGALRRGRRVVSNVAGLNLDAMKDVLLAEGIPEERIGCIVQVEHAKVLEPSFWRTDRDAEDGTDAFVQPGDLVALDEIWRFWSGFATKGEDGQKRPDRVMNFYRMHRHFTHPETGIACDVALITQDVMDISRQVRAVIEETYYMEKLTAVGSSSRYRVDIHQGGKISRKPLRSIQRSYNPALFGLYSSHSQKKEGDADAKEENIDKRGNLLGGPLFRIVLPLMFLIILPIAVWRVWVFLHPNPDAGKVQTASSGKPESTSAVSHAKPSAPDVSESWRAMGYYLGSGETVILASDGQMVRALVNPPSFKLAPYSVETFLPSGEAVTSWSGRREAGIIDRAAGK